MALVIANPACCCALTTPAQNASTSCCSGKSQDNDGDKHSCPCSIDKQKSTHEVDLNIPVPTGPELQVAASPAPATFLPKLPEAVSFLKKWPPGRIPLPTTGNRLAAKCSYLI